MESFEFNGLRIAFERRGAGPPLVMLHGILQDSAGWRAQTSDLAADHTVVAWDAPGCGRSSDPPETFRLPEYADCLAALFDHAGIGAAHVLGLSWGGGLALQFCERYPDSVLSLVLTGAYAGWAGSLPAEIVEQRLEQCLRESLLSPAEFVEGWIPGLLTESAPTAVRAETVKLMSGFHPSGYRTMAHAIADADLRDSLSRVRVPTLLLWGADDRRSPLGVAEALLAAIPGSKLVVLPAAGHLSNMEAPAAFNAAVRDFTRSV